MIAVGIVAGFVCGFGLAYLVLRAAGNDKQTEAAAELARLTEQVEEERAVVDRLVAGLDQVSAGVVIAGQPTEPVIRNRIAAAFVDARHGDVLVGDVVDRLMLQSEQGELVSEQVEIFGPPRRTFFVTAEPIEVDGQWAGAIAMVNDVTEQRRLDDVRRDFVANVSHELRTPIGALSLLAETLIDETDPETVRRLSGRMQAEAERVSRTIDDLLVLSRMEDADNTDEWANVDVRDVANSAVERIAEAARLKGVEVVPPPGHEPMIVLGDPVQLESAFLNLLDNAVKYSEAGTVVLVRLADGAGVAAITVQDHGIGIPAGESDRIFERFYRIDRARSRTTGGTGLGLSIVRHVVRNHGGDIQISSREGVGSTFTILIPQPALESA